MTKADLIDEVSRISNLTKKETELIVNTVFDNITEVFGRTPLVPADGSAVVGPLPARAAGWR